MTETHNELDIVVKYAKEKGGGVDGQLIIDDVEVNRSRDNRTRHGIGNDEPQHIEKGNKEYTFSTTTMMSDAAANALKRVVNGAAEQQGIYVMKKDDDGGTAWKESASGMIWNDVSESASDGGDTTMSIDADLLGLELSGDNLESV